MRKEKIKKHSVKKETEEKSKPVPVLDRDAELKLESELNEIELAIIKAVFSNDSKKQKDLEKEKSVIIKKLGRNE